jgi:hypothetical protein
MPAAIAFGLYLPKTSSKNLKSPSIKFSSSTMSALADLKCRQAELEAQIREQEEIEAERIRVADEQARIEEERRAVEQARREAEIRRLAEEEELQKK